MSNQRRSTNPVALGTRSLVLLAIPVAVVGASLILLPRAWAGVLALLAAGETPVSLPTRFEVPRAPGDALIVAGGFVQADLVTTGLDASTRWLLGVGQVLEAVTLLTLLVVGVSLAWSLWRGREFQGTTSARLMAGGLALVIGGAGSAVLVGLGRVGAAEQLNPAAGGIFRTEFSFDPTLVCVGLAALAIALVVRHGETLDDDTDGLV